MSNFNKKNIPNEYCILLMLIPNFFYFPNVNAKENSDSLSVIEFDPSFLNVDGPNQIDIKRFSYGSSAIPGVFKTSLYVNNTLTSNANIEFRAGGDSKVTPCISINEIKNIPLSLDKLPEGFITGSETEKCIDITKIIPGSLVNYDSNEQRLDVSIPQIYMSKTPRGTVSTELWDSGIPVMTLGYNISGYNSQSSGHDFNSIYAGINAGVNIGAWYIRHNGSYNESGNDTGSYSSLNSYLQRDIPRFRSRALIGQSNTNGELFDTLPFTGVQIATDERMLPESQRGYAPEIRGIAKTNARVTVRQGEQILYETSVPPGAFLINDLYPTGYGGDLIVIVREADGSEQRFSVPFSSVAQLLRPETTRYAITAGKLRSEIISDNPLLTQFTIQHGITNNLTGYSGLQFNKDYYAFQLGTAIGTPLGAVAFDTTHAHTKLGTTSRSSNFAFESDNVISGQSYQIRYSKLIRNTDSNISLAAYRFSTNGYMDYLTAMQARDVIKKGFSADSILRAKNRMTLTYGQGLPSDFGQLYISSSLQNYWNKSGTDKQYQLGFSNQYKLLSWGLSVSKSFSSVGRQQTNYLLSLNLPLGGPNRDNALQLRTELNHDSSGRTGEQLSLSGSGGKDNQYTYGVTTMHMNKGFGTTGTVNGSYRSERSQLNASLSAGNHYRSVTGGINGTIVAHSGGVTFTPYISDTMALIEAKGAEGARITSYPGIRIDSHGYAVVPYLSPYQYNEISIDPKGISNQTELTSTTQKVSPYLGAVVKMKYETRQGTAVLINASWRGDPVPFGAEVFDSKGNMVGSVGQGGQIYARVSMASDRLLIKWGNDSDSQCHVRYQALKMQKNRFNSYIQQFNGLCQ